MMFYFKLKICHNHLTSFLLSFYYFSLLICNPINLINKSINGRHLFFIIRMIQKYFYPIFNFITDIIFTKFYW